MFARSPPSVVFTTRDRDDWAGISVMSRWGTVAFGEDERTLTVDESLAVGFDPTDG
jgi:hypothetical protein